MDGCSRVIYVCRSRYLSHTIAPILAWSKQHLQGLAVYGHGYFFQWAEGSTAQVDGLLERLMQLADGFELCILNYEEIPSTMLDDWRTHYALDGLDVGELLTTHGLPVAQAELLVDLMDTFRQTHQIAAISSSTVR